MQAGSTDCEHRTKILSKTQLRYLYITLWTCEQLWISCQVTEGNIPSGCSQPRQSEVNEGDSDPT